MKIKDIYNSEAIETTKDLSILKGYQHDHLPELDVTYYPENLNQLVTVKIHFDPYIDGNRVCTIGSVWCNDVPVMLFRHAGRSGADQYDRFVTYPELYDRMIQYLRSLLPKEKIEDFFQEDQEYSELDRFYGADMVIKDNKLSKI